MHRHCGRAYLYIHNMHNTWTYRFIGNPNIVPSSLSLSVFPPKFLLIFDSTSYSLSVSPLEQHRSTRAVGMRRRDDVILIMPVGCLCTTYNTSKYDETLAMKCLSLSLSLMEIQHFWSSENCRVGNMVGLPPSHHHQAVSLSYSFFLSLSLPVAARPAMLCNSTRLISAAAKFPWNSISSRTFHPSLYLSISSPPPLPLPPFTLLLLFYIKDVAAMTMATRATMFVCSILDMILSFPWHLERLSGLPLFSLLSSCCV